MRLLTSAQHNARRSSDGCPIMPLSFIEFATHSFASAIKDSVGAAQPANNITAKSVRIFFTSSSGITRSCISTNNSARQSGKKFASTVFPDTEFAPASSNSVVAYLSILSAGGYGTLASGRYLAGVSMGTAAAIIEKAAADARCSESQLPAWKTGSQRGELKIFWEIPIGH